MLGKREERRTREKIAQVFTKNLTFLFQGPLKKYRPINAETVALAMTRIAEQAPGGIYVYESEKIKKAL